MDGRAAAWQVWRSGARQRKHRLAWQRILLVELSQTQVRRLPSFNLQFRPATRCERSCCRVLGQGLSHGLQCQLCGAVPLGARKLAEELARSKRLLIAARVLGPRFACGIELNGTAEACLGTLKITEEV
eukprot:1799334-Rhodomonas_salina.1